MSDTDGQVDVITIEQHAPTRTVAGRRGGTLTPFDSERARQANLRRRELAGQRVRKAALAAGAQLPNVNVASPLDVVEYVAEQHWLNAADPSAPGSVKSWHELMSYAYPQARDDSAAGAGIPAGGAQLTLSAELARELIAELRARRQVNP